MAITSELIGKLGGGSVEIFPVDTYTGTNPVVLRRITVPAGEQMLVAVAGNSPTMSSNTDNYPELQIGESKSRPLERYGRYSAVAVISQSTDVVLDRRGSSIHRADFEGTIYTAKM